MAKSKIDTKRENAILTPTEVADELSLKVETVRELMRQKRSSNQPLCILPHESEKQKIRPAVCCKMEVTKKAMQG